MTRVIVNIKNMGKDPKNKKGNLVAFDVTADVKKSDPKWILGLTKVVREAVETLLEQTVGIKKEK